MLYLKNILIFVPVSAANQNAPVPKNFEQAEMMKQIQKKIFSKNNSATARCSKLNVKVLWKHLL